MATNPKVDFYFTKNDKWRAEINLMRSIILDCKLTEVLKWGCPCYMHDDSNIVLIHTFKEYCAILFFKGALINDPKGYLIQQTANVQAARQMRFTSIDEVTKQQAAIKALVKDAIRVEKSGAKVELKKTTEFEMVPEFAQVLKTEKSIRKSFEALTPGRQRAYLLHFSSTKQTKTRMARIEKNIPNILNGKGLNE